MFVCSCLGSMCLSLSWVWGGVRGSWTLPSHGSLPSLWGPLAVGHLYFLICKNNRFWLFPSVFTSLFLAVIFFSNCTLVIHFYRKVGEYEKLHKKTTILNPIA